MWILGLKGLKAQTRHVWLYMYIKHEYILAITVANVLLSNINLLEIAFAKNHV